MTVILAALLLAAPGEPPPLRLATGLFTFVGLKDELKVFVPEHLASRMRTIGVVVVTPREVMTLLGRERQRQLLGCEDAVASCTAELVGALGVDGVLMGEVAAVGDFVQINLKVVSETGKLLGSWSHRIEGLNHLLEALDEGGTALGTQVLLETGRSPRARAQVSDLAWVPLVAGAIIGAGSAVLLVISKADHDQLTQPQATLLTPVQASEVAQQGALFQTAGFVALGVASGALLAGAGMAIFGAAPPVVPSVTVGASGAAWSVSLKGSFP